MKDVKIGAAPSVDTGGDTERPVKDNESPRPHSPHPGLCATCRHAQRVESSRGSTFVLCRLSFTDARFPKYPALPVVRCGGYEEQGLAP